MTTEATEPGTTVEKVAPNRRRPSVDRKTKGPAGKAIPPSAKKPADHQPAKTDVVEAEAIEVEWHGHKYRIETDAFDDLEFVEAMMDMDSETDDSARAVQAFKGLRQLLGPAGMAAYKENERDKKTGRVSFQGVVLFFNYLMEESKRKNSSASSTS